MAEVGHASQEAGCAIAFFDASNLFYDAKYSFQYDEENFDPMLLARAVSEEICCELLEARYYSGIPSRRVSPNSHRRNRARQDRMISQGVAVYSRSLRYTRPDWAKGRLVPREKGIDVRLALDVIDRLLETRADTIIIFSTDQDYSELAQATKKIGKIVGRTIRLVSAFPDDPNNPRRRAIRGFEPFRITKTLYDACIDPRDYRPRARRRPR